MTDKYFTQTCPYCSEPMKRGDGSFWCMNTKCAEQFYPSGNDEIPYKDKYLTEEIATLGRCLGRAIAQKEEDEKSGYDVLALDGEEEIANLRRTIGRLEGFARIQERRNS